MNYTDRLFPTNKNNKCPICGDISGKCRTKDNEEQAVLCAGSGFARKFDREGLYICTNHSGKGHTSHTWVLAKEDFDNWDDTRKEEYYKEKSRRAAAAEKARIEAIFSEMSAVDRNCWGFKVVEELQLLDKHHEQLEAKRNLPTEVIKRICFRSVTQWQKLSFKCPDNYPGYNPKKQSLICQEGMIAPIRQEGEIVGFENRLDNPGEDEGRYRVVSSQTYTSIHLMDEMPLGVYHSKEADQDKGIWVIEGKAWKPQIANELFDIPVLAGGRYWRNSPNHAAKFLLRFKEIYGNRIILTLDAGDIINRNVFSSWIDECKFFQSQGFDVKFAWWGQITKEESDIDELLTLNNIKYLDIDEILAISNSNEVKKESLDNWAWQQWVKSRKFTPDIIMSDKYFQFPELPKHNALISIMASLGKGKTYAMILEILRAGRGMHLIGYRNNLLFQTIVRAKEAGLEIYHFNDDDGNMVMADDTANLAYCLDSILKVEGYFRGRDIYIDESCSVLVHALEGGTLSDNQAAAIRILSTAINEADRVFLLDGNNSDLYTNFFHKLCPCKQLIKIQNTHDAPKHNIKFVDAVSDDEIKSRDRSPLIQMLLDPEVIPWIYCDSKERTKILDQMMRENGKSGYCLNSETAGDDWAKEFLANPDKFITDKKPGYIIVSPTAESGISVSLCGYFTDKFTFLAGVTGTNGQVQGMFRLRDEFINHYVFCPEWSTVTKRNSPHTFSVKQYQEIMNNRILESGLLASHSANNPSRALEVIGAAIAKTKDDWWEMSAELGVLDNYEMANLRKCLIYALEQAGHNVEVLQIESDECTKKAETIARETVQKVHAKELDVSVEFETIEEAKKAAKANPRKDTQRRIEKTFLLERLPGIMNSSRWGDEFIYECHIKRREFIKGIEKYWLVKNCDISQKRHESAWFYQATKEDFYSARVKGMTHTAIWALKELDIIKFTDGREYHKNSEDVVNLIVLLRERKDIQIALRYEHLPKATETGKERLGIILKLLAMIGYKNKSEGKKFVGDIRLNHYQAVPISYKEELLEGQFDLDAAREDILAAVEQRFTSWMQSDKSVIDWEEKPEEEAVVVVEVLEDVPMSSIEMKALEVQNVPATEELKPMFYNDSARADYELGNAIAPAPTPQQLAASTIKTWQSWQQLDQEIINLGWHCLTAEEQAQVSRLIDAQPQQQQTEEIINLVGRACRVLHYGGKDGIIKSWEELGKGIKAAIDIGGGFEIMAWSRAEVVLC